MGLFLFIDGPALVCRWVNFPILLPHTPRTNEVEVPPRAIFTTYGDQAFVRECSRHRRQYWGVFFTSKTVNYLELRNETSYNLETW